MAQLRLRESPGLTGRVATKELAMWDPRAWLKVEGLLVPQSAVELVQAIASNGSFEVAWNTKAEEISWRYANPPAKN